MKTYIGTYWKTEKQAIKDALEKTKRFGFEFGVMEFENGYLVLSERQTK